MKLFFDPETIALVGASATEGRPGHDLFQNLQNSSGIRFYPVNPRLEKIGDKACYKSVLDLPGEIDLTVVFIPANGIPDVLEQCAEKGIRRVIIESGGFAEAGPEGRAIHKRCLDIAREGEMRLWGPNCMGMLNVPRKKILSFMVPWIWQGLFSPGEVSLVVQSGMLSAGFLASFLSRTPFGLSKVCSIGNKMDVDEVDLLEYLIDDPETGVIALYLESLERGRRFVELARTTEKPIIVLKAGHTSFGRQAAQSHTAALAQDDRILDAALRQAHIIRVHGMEEMMDVARCLGTTAVKSTSRARVAVMTFSGGGGVVTSDNMHESGLELAALTPETIAKLQQVFPEWFEPSNPVDTYPAIEKHEHMSTFRHILDALMADPGIDALYVHLFTSPPGHSLYDYDHMAEMIRKHQKPMVAWLLGRAEFFKDSTLEIEKRGIPVVDEIHKGVRVLTALTLRR